MVYRTRESSLGIEGSDMFPVSREFRAWVQNSRLTLSVDIDNSIAHVDVYRFSVSTNLSCIALDNDGEQSVHRSFWPAMSEPRQNHLLIQFLTYWFPGGIHIKFYRI